MPRKAKPKSEPGTSTRTMLSHAQFFRLASFIKEQKGLIEAKKMNSVQLSQEASKELGFPISEHAVFQACETVGVVLYSQKVRVNAHKLSGPEVIHILAKEIQSLQAGLGVAASEDFKTLLERL